jgi:hypothetical protein
MKKLMIAVAAIATLSTAPAHADSQLAGALYAIGVSGGLNWIAQRTNPQEDAMADSQRALYESQRDVNEYPNFICNSDPVECSYQRGIYDQAKEQWYQAKDNAYNCGRYGTDCQ